MIQALCFISFIAICFNVALGSSNVIISNYTAKTTNLTTKFLIGDDAKDSARCTITHLANTEFFVTFWTNYDKYFCNINSALYLNNGELVESFENSFDPTDGYESIYSYGIRSTQCPLLNNSVSLTAITFYRKVNGESHSKIYLKLLFSNYNNSIDTQTSATDSNSNNKLDYLTVDWSDLILISDNNNSDASSSMPDISCIQHGPATTTTTTTNTSSTTDTTGTPDTVSEKVINSVGIMVAWEHYTDEAFHNIYARYLIVNQTNGTEMSENDGDNIEFGNNNYVITKGNIFLVSNISNASVTQMDQYPYVSGRYIENSKNSSNSVETFLITRTVENSQGYSIIANAFEIDTNLVNATNYKPKLAKNDFSVALIGNGSDTINSVSFSQGQLSTCCWNQISLSIGGYLVFYTYFDSSDELYSLYLSYIYENTFDVNNAILVSKTSHFDYYGEMIELIEDSSDTSDSDANSTNVFVLFGNYDTDSLKHSVLGKLYHIAMVNDGSVTFEEISVNSRNQSVSGATTIKFEYDEHELYYKCTASNRIGTNDDNDNNNNGKSVSSDIMIAWTDWGYDIYGKFVNFEIINNQSTKSKENNTNPYYSTGVQTEAPRTSVGYFTTNRPKLPDKDEGDGDISETSIVLIVVIGAMALMCISCVCVFGWLIYKGKVNIQIGQANGSAAGQRLLADENMNNVQLTSEEIDKDRAFSAVM